MQKPNFNFVTHSVLKKSSIDFILVALAILLAAILFIVYQFKLSAFNDLQAKKDAQPVIRTKPINPQFAEHLQHFKIAQHTLNVPWMETFNALELVKQAHPNVQFLSVEPNLNRNEIKIKVKAEAFDEVTALLESLRKSPLFNEAELVSQHIETTDEEVVTVFDIHLGWKI